MYFFRTENTPGADVLSKYPSFYGLQFIQDIVVRVDNFMLVNLTLLLFFSGLAKVSTLFSSLQVL